MSEGTAEMFGYDSARRERDSLVQQMEERGLNPANIGEVVITGSGLGGFANDHMEAKKAGQTSGPLAVSFNKEWEGLGVPPMKGGVGGHAKRILIGPLSGTSEDHLVFLQDGREHPYEMIDSNIATKRATFWLRVAQLLSHPKVGIGSNASGIITPRSLSPNDLILVNSIFDTKDDSPLKGPLDPRFGTRFPHKSDLFSVDMRAMIQQTANELGIKMKQGTYVRKGPAYESPEEVYDLREMLDKAWLEGRAQAEETRFNGRLIGGVGMSSTYEMEVMTHAAQPALDEEFEAWGMEVERHVAFLHRALISVATNYSASLGPHGIVAPSKHVDVKESAAAVQEQVGKLFREVLLKTRTSFWQNR